MRIFGGKFRVHKGSRLFVLLASMTFTACYVEVQEDDQSYSDGGWERDKPSQSEYRLSRLPTEVSGMGRMCEIWEDADHQGGEWTCYEHKNYEWRTSCREADCQGLKVFTHYMLTEDLGAGHTLHLEAFDNAYFSGTPISATQITDFKAKTGEWEEAEVFLSPGEYYMRAYLKTQDDTRIPYQFGDMGLVADQPVGVFGVLSGAQKVVVKPRYDEQFGQPVHIYLDKLFHKPGLEPDTKAYLRLNLSVTQGEVAPDGRDIHINLYATPDFQIEPVKKMSMASELLLVSGREGRAEFISASLPVGKFFLQIFVDANSNGYLDSGELAAEYEKYGELAMIDIAENRTETVALVLDRGLANDGDEGE